MTDQTTDQTTDQKKAEPRKLSDAARAMLKKVKDNVRITKVVCTRSVKGKNGDHYVGFSAAWNTIQDDAGGAADLMAGPDESMGLTLQESKVASILLGMQTDMAAYENAYAGGDISKQHLNDARNGIKANYGKLLMDLLGEVPDEAKAAPVAATGS